mmetsp:Transcript_95336/g.218366  ORF Transcript_95336/g.218366 Transcript_95336/m.218366 type:complete len:355 (+) Transcript_95336:38-1102(+)
MVLTASLLRDSSAYVADVEQGATRHFGQRGAWAMTRVIMAILLMQSCIAGLYVVNRMAVHGRSGIAPLHFTWFRYLISVAALHVLLAIQTKRLPWSNLPATRHLPLFALYGCTHVYFGQYCSMVAAQYVPAVVNSLFLNMSPVCVCWFGVLAGVERLTTVRYSAHLKVAGALVAIAGACTYTLASTGGFTAEDKSGYDYLTGVLWLTMSLLGGSVFHVSEKVCLNHGYPVLTVVTWGATFGLALLTCLISPTVDRGTFDLYWDQWLLVVYAALVPSTVSSLAGAWAKKQSSPLLVVTFFPFGTVVTAGIAWMVLGEVPSEAVFVAAPVIVLGLYLLVLGQLREVVDEHSGKLVV